MKMPIVSYFLVMGTVLTALLILAGNYIPGGAPPFSASQAVGISQPFKAEPERSPYTVSAVNFAASYGKPPIEEMTVPVKKHFSESTRKRLYEPTNAGPTPSGWNRVAENPHNALMSIH